MIHKPGKAMSRPKIMVLGLDISKSIINGTHTINSVTQMKLKSITFKTEQHDNFTNHKLCCSNDYSRNKNVSQT